MKFKDWLVSCRESSISEGNVSLTLAHWNILALVRSFLCACDLQLLQFCKYIKPGSDAANEIKKELFRQLQFGNLAPCLMWIGYQLICEIISLKEDGVSQRWDTSAKDMQISYRSLMFTTDLAFCFERILKPIHSVDFLYGVLSLAKMGPEMIAVALFFLDWERKWREWRAC